MNKSRAQWRAIASKIPLQIDDLDKIPQISDEIKETLRSNPKVFLGKEAPHCYLSRVEKSFAELTIGCNLKYMVLSLSLLSVTFSCQKKREILFFYWCLRGKRSFTQHNKRFFLSQSRL